jgi:hypothetical protein
MKHANNISIIDEALEVATSKGAFGRRQAAQIDTAFNILVQALKTYQDKEDAEEKAQKELKAMAEEKGKAEEHFPDLGIDKTKKDEPPKTPKHKGN